MVKGIIRFILFIIAPNLIGILVTGWMFFTLYTGVTDCAGFNKGYSCDPNMIVTPSIIIGSAFAYVRIKHALKKT